jgi:hypothetical protein
MLPAHYHIDRIFPGKIGNEQKTPIKTGGGQENDVAISRKNDHTMRPLYP